MKKILVTIMICAFALSFAGLTMAAEEKKAEAKPAAAVTPATPAVTAPATPAAPAKPALTPEDMKWIAQCLIDNKDEGQAMDVVQKYCECMNSKMEDNETQSVTQWEKSHKKEQKECSEKAGWK